MNAPVSRNAMRPDDQVGPGAERVPESATIFWALGSWMSPVL